MQGTKKYIKMAQLSFAFVSFLVFLCLSCSSARELMDSHCDKKLRVKCYSGFDVGYGIGIGSVSNQYTPPDGEPERGGNSYGNYQTTGQVVGTGTGSSSEGEGFGIGMGTGSGVSTRSQAMGSGVVYGSGAEGMGSGVGFGYGSEYGNAPRVGVRPIPYEPGFVAGSGYGAGVGTGGQLGSGSGAGLGIGVEQHKVKGAGFPPPSGRRSDEKQRAQNGAIKLMMEDAEPSPPSPDSNVNSRSPPSL